MLLGLLGSPEGEMGGKTCMKTKIETLGYSFDIFCKGTEVSIEVKSCHE